MSALGECNRPHDSGTPVGHDVTLEECTCRTHERVVLVILGLLLLLVTTSCGNPIPAEQEQAGSSGDVPQPEGQWTKIEEGFDAGTSWGVFHAGATLGGTCLSLEFSPVPSPDFPDSFAENVYMGRPAACVSGDLTRRGPAVSWLQDGPDGIFSFMLVTLPESEEEPIRGWTESRSHLAPVGSGRAGVLRYALFVVEGPEKFKKIEIGIGASPVSCLINPVSSDLACSN